MYLQCVLSALLLNPTIDQGQTSSDTGSDVPLSNKGMIVDPRDFRACGVSCFYVLCHILDVDITRQRAEALLNPSAAGLTSFQDLARAASELHLSPIALRLRTPAQLHLLPPPAVLQVKSAAGQEEGDHFVLFLGCTPRHAALVLDSPKPPVEIPLLQLALRWTGNVMLVCRSQEETENVRDQILSQGRSEWVTWATSPPGIVVLGLVLIAAFIWARKRLLRNRPLLFSRLSLMITLLPCFLLGCSDSGSPKLVFDSHFRDFGYVPRQGMDLRLPLTNRGNGVLQVEDVKASCKCVIIDPPKHIRGGETRELVIRTPRAVTGSMSAKILVLSNDPLSPHELFISWFGDSPPTLNPPRIVIHEARPRSIIDRVIQLAWASGERLHDLTVQKTAVSNDAFTLHLQGTKRLASFSVIAPGGDIRPVTSETTLILRCRVPEQVGILKATATIWTVQAGQKEELHLPIEVHVAGPLSCTPSSFLFASESHQSLIGLKRRLLLKSRTGRPPIIQSAPSLVRCQLVPLSAPVGSESNPGSEQRYLLEVEILQRPTEDMRELAIVVQDGEKGALQLSIPIQILTLE